MRRGAWTAINVSKLSHCRGPGISTACGANLRSPEISIFVYGAAYCAVDCIGVALLNRLRSHYGTFRSIYRTLRDSNHICLAPARSKLRGIIQVTQCCHFDSRTAVDTERASSPSGCRVRHPPSHGLKASPGRLVGNAHSHSHSQGHSATQTADTMVVRV